MYLRNPGPSDVDSGNAKNDDTRGRIRVRRLVASAIASASTSASHERRTAGSRRKPSAKISAGVSVLRSIAARSLAHASGAMASRRTNILDDDLTEALEKPPVPACRRNFDRHGRHEAMDDVEFLHAE